MQAIKKISYHKKVVSKVNFVSFHGPFIDLFVTSPDPAIVEVCTKRHNAALHAAEIGVEIFVSHLNYIPLINNEAYLNTFVQKATEFWLPLADVAEKHNITMDTPWYSQINLRLSGLKALENI